MKKKGINHSKRRVYRCNPIRSFFYKISLSSVSKNVLENSSKKHSPHIRILRFHKYNISEILTSDRNQLLLNKKHEPTILSTIQKNSGFVFLRKRREQYGFKETSQEAK